MPSPYTCPFGLAEGQAPRPALGKHGIGMGRLPDPPAPSGLSWGRGLLRPRATDQWSVTGPYLRSNAISCFCTIAAIVVESKNTNIK